MTIQRLSKTFKSQTYSDNIFTSTMRWADFITLVKKHGIDTNKQSFRYRGDFMTWEEFFTEEDIYERMATITFIRHNKHKQKV